MSYCVIQQQQQQWLLLILLKKSNLCEGGALDISAESATSFVYSLHLMNAFKGCSCESLHKTSALSIIYWYEISEHHYGSLWINNWTNELKFNPNLMLCILTICGFRYELKIKAKKMQAAIMVCRLSNVDRNRYTKSLSSCIAHGYLIESPWCIG